MLNDNYGGSEDNLSLLSNTEQNDKESRHGYENESTGGGSNTESNMALSPFKDTALMNEGIEAILLRMERKIDAQTAEITSLRTDLEEFKAAYKLEMEANQQYRQQCANELKTIQSNQQAEQDR